MYAISTEKKIQLIVNTLSLQNILNLPGYERTEDDSEFGLMEISSDSHVENCNSVATCSYYLRLD